MTDQITIPAQMREAAALMPCPFCGGEANVEHSIHDDDHRFPRSFWHVRVICMGCDLAQRWALYGKQEPRYNDHEGRVEAEAAAITAWNRRALPVAEPEPLAVNAVMCAAERDAQSRDAVDLTLFRQAIRAEALDDAAQAVSNRAAYWWAEATAADDTGRKKLSLSYEAKALACIELAAVIRVLKEKPE